MATVTTERFRINNLDCAACASKIENNLRKLDGVETVSLSFATLTLAVKARDMELVLETVRRIEPGVTLIPENEDKLKPVALDHGADYRPWKALLYFGASATLFLLLLAFEDRFHTPSGVWLEYVVTFTAYLLAGWNVISGAARTIRRGEFFDENVLMVIATGGAMAIHALTEAVGVMIFFKIGEMLQDLAVSKSRGSIRALLAAQPDHANVQSESGLKLMRPDQVNVGAMILVKPGEKIPLDGVVITGDSQVNSAPLTGESMPAGVRPGDAVMAGAINLTAALSVRVTKPFQESSIAKILALVENAAARKAETEKFITTFARYYTPVVVLIAAAVALVPPLLVAGAAFQTWIYRALVLLVISCPCALVVSIPLGYFGGIGRASRRGILIKGSNFIDALSQVKTVVFDKTGTLTRGVFEVGQVVSFNGYSEQKLLEYAAAAELHSDHPIAKSIIRAYTEQGGDVAAITVHDHRMLAGSGVKAIVNGSMVLVGNDALLHRENIDHDQCVADGTTVHVVINGKYAGYFLMGDQLKPEAPEAVARLRESGVERIVMLTGDNACAAEHVAEHLNLDAFHAGLLPEDKVRVFEEIVARNGNNGKVAYVGDGINDAPVIARADVGVAMGALGSDAAIETADVVLMTDSPAKMAEAVAIARETRRIVWQNIFLALTVKGLFVAFGAFGLATMWEAVFADMGTALAAVVNSTRALGKNR